jgi:DNA-binding response OmpR family regulator
MPKLLWVDDEIELLKPHLLFLEEKGYDVESATNGADAIERVRSDHVDVVLLDEQMPGMGGLDTLPELKDAAPNVPVVMITKSEEENLMEEALGRQIADYLTKPVNPSQVLLTLKRLLEGERLESEQISQSYMQTFNRISQRLQSYLSHEEWVELYLELMGYDLEIDSDEGARQILNDQMQEANRAFGRFVEESYPTWIQNVDQAPDESRPALSHEVIDEFVLPEMEDDKPVVFFVIDCLRYDQWLVFEELLRGDFSMEKDFYYSILPTATPYSRNSIFSGLLPQEIAERYPRIWEQGEDDEHSRNRNEQEFLEDLLDRRRVDASLRYDKLIGSDDGQSFADSAADLTQHDLAAVVVNFVDVLAHSRSDSDVLKELAPDERAYRDLTRTWFEHSWLLRTFRALAKRDCTVVVTTDHGAVRCLHSTEVIGDRETSTALRYKYGNNLKADEQHAIFVKDPESYGLPAPSINTNYILAKEDYYFVYPTNFHHYEKKYRDTMQHGGASMQEMLLPVVTMTPKG